MATLDVYLDFKSPGAYLAVKPTLTLIETLRPTVQWLPFVSSQRALPPVRTVESRGETHIRVREKAKRETHLKYARLQNTPMEFPASPGCTDLALAALLYANADPVPFIQSAYHAYWVDQLDLNDPNVVDTLLRDAGHDPDAFAAEEFLAELPAVQSKAEELGIVDAPAYLIDDGVFIGREHLPWLRHSLEQN